MFTTYSSIRWLLPAFIILCCQYGVAAQSTSIFVEGNLILSYPLQSSIIFALIIVSSVGLEVVVAKLEELENKYLRVTLRLFREEVTVFGLAEVLLLTVKSGFSLDPLIEQEISLIALVLVCMTFAYGIINSALAIVLQARGKAWRRFEWARLDADAHHDSQERLYKLGRKWFVELVTRLVAQQNKRIKEFPPVAFAVFMAKYERKYLKALFDITFVSWVGLGVAVVVNMGRSIIIGESVVWEVHSFILLFGYGSAITFFVMSLIVSTRLSSYLAKALSAEGFAMGIGGPDTPTTTSALLFDSFDVTLQLTKGFHLVMLWYVGYYIVVEAYLSYVAHGWFCFLVGIEALAPLVMFYAQLPSHMFVSLMCLSLGKHVDEDIVEELLTKGIASANDLMNESSSDSDEEEDERLERTFAEASQRNQAAGSQQVSPLGRLGQQGMAVHHQQQLLGAHRPMLQQDEIDDERIPCEDEPAEGFGTFHDKAKDTVPPGDPTRVMGVPPTNAMERRWRIKPIEPVFL